MGPLHGAISESAPPCQDNRADSAQPAELLWVSGERTKHHPPNRSCRCRVFCVLAVFHHCFRNTKFPEVYVWGLF